MSLKLVKYVFKDTVYFEYARRMSIKSHFQKFTTTDIQ